MKFVTHFGSYTLVLKPDGKVPIYDHTGKPVRVEGTVYCEFKAVKGSSVGMYQTEDKKIIKCLQEHENFDKKFRQLKTEADFVKLTQTVNDKQITLPKSALMACNKTELNDIAKQYDLEFNEDDTKSKMVDAVMKAQANPSTKKEEVEAPMQQGPDGGIKQIFQNPQVN